MEFLGKVAMFDEMGNQVSSFYDSIDTTSSEYFAIVSKKSGNTTLYNFMTAEGKVISKEWFIKVEPFKKDYEAVRVERIGGYQNLLNREGRLIILHNRYEILTPLIDGRAIVKNVYGEQNIINSKGSLISRRWMYNVICFNGDFARVEVEKNRYNFVDMKGKFLLKRSAAFTSFNKFIIAIAGKNLTVIREDTCEIIYATKEYFNMSFMAKGLRIQNLYGDYNFLNRETGQPIFEKWQISLKAVWHTDYICAIENTEDNAAWYIYDTFGNKLTEQSFVAINDINRRGDYCNVKVIEDGNRVEKWLNLKTFEVKDRLSMLEVTECI